MEDLDYHLLAWLELGHSVFRPAERTQESRQEFQALAERLAGLRARGFIQYQDNHISRTESGEYLLIGPAPCSQRVAPPLSGTAIWVRGHRGATIDPGPVTEPVTVRA